MSTISRHPTELVRAQSPAWMLDGLAKITVTACVYALIVSPMMAYLLTRHSPNMLEPDIGARIFWPAMMVATLVLGLRSSNRLVWPPHILLLFACLAFAGASVIWAYKPESSFVRFVQQVMVVTTIVVPALMADRKSDLMRALFLCFAFACVLNVFFVIGGEQVVVQNGKVREAIGYPGYFLGKNYLGECATLAALLSVHEMLHPGRRRWQGIIIMVVALFLVFRSDSKTALGLAIVTPCVAGITLMISRKLRISPAVILLTIPLTYILLSSVSNFNVNRLAYMLYGDLSLTGRTIIWDFADIEIAKRPFFGWGYQSFWLVGADAPSVVEAPGFVKMMPNGHNGYYDTTLELGYVGYYLFVCFIVATLHAVGRVVQRDAARAWLLLSLALYVICFNCLESLWMRGFEFLWVVFLITAAEIGRYWQPLPQKAQRRDLGFAVPWRPRPARDARRHTLD